MYAITVRTTGAASALLSLSLLHAAKHIGSKKQIEKIFVFIILPIGYCYSPLAQSFALR
jgi:hypothetical protein